LNFSLAFSGPISSGLNGVYTTGDRWHRPARVGPNRSAGRTRSMPVNVRGSAIMSRGMPSPAASASVMVKNRTLSFRCPSTMRKAFGTWTPVR
jgi:hypothetical protein